MSQRLGRLEQTLGAGEPCRECGRGGGPVQFIFAGELARGEAHESRPCATCGRARSITIRLGEAMDDEGKDE